MRKKIFILFIVVIISGISSTIGLCSEEEITTNAVYEEMMVLRDDNFEGYGLGAIYNGAVFVPTSGENKNMGVSSKDNSYWFRGNAMDGRGGFSTTVNKGIQGNLVSVIGKDGNPTQAVQILRPENTGLTSAKLGIYPQVSIETAKLHFSADLKNSGKTGAEGDAGYTREVGNCFDTLTFYGIILNFSQKTITFPKDAGINPPAEAEEYRWALPDNGQWIHFEAEIDVFESTITIWIDGKKIATKLYYGKFTGINSNNLDLSVKSAKTGENAIYFDNFKLEVSNLTTEQLARKRAADAFSYLGNAMVLYPGSPTIYFGEDVLKFDKNNLSLYPLEREGVIYVPARTVSELFGYVVSWNEKTGETTISTRENTSKFQADLLEYAWNGKALTADHEPFNLDGRLYIPLEDLSRVLGKELYHGETGLILLCDGDDNFPKDPWKNQVLDTVLSLYPEASMGFETAGGWYTQADLIKASGATLEELAITRKEGAEVYEYQRNGVKQSTEQVKSGKYSGKWENHHYYPTVMATNAPKDWSGYNCLTFWMYSEHATNEHITVGAVSNVDKVWENLDNTTNFLYYGIDIDFTGWKQFVLPLELFEKSSNNVQGFDKVDGLYFYTRAFNYEPSPYTVLYLDDVKPETLSEDKYQVIIREITAKKEVERLAKDAPKDYVVSVPDVFKEVSLVDYTVLLEQKKIIEEKGTGKEKARKKVQEILIKYNITEDPYSYSDLVERAVVDIGTEEISWDKIRVNHEEPEVVNQIEPGQPLITQTYFKEARAMYGYDPRFLASYTTTYQDMKFMTFASRAFQVCDEDRNWHLYDISLQIDKFVKEKLGHEEWFKLRDSGFLNETKLRFDKDGDAYMCIMVQIPQEVGDSLVYGILCHSRDNLKTWDFYELPRFQQKFEVLEGNNSDCMEGPPVILLHNYWTSKDQSGAFVIPEKQPDGTLVIPKETIFADKVVNTSPHSGKGNFCITANGKLYIIYSTPYNSTEESYQIIPKDHPIWQAKSTARPTYVTADGVPAFIISYDLKTKIFTEPVFVGCGGAHSFDGHNWSALSIDAEGYFHAFCIGHHSPLYYVKSVRPYDITEWTIPELISDGLSYASINIDSKGTIYSFTRNSNRGYNFDITMHRKKVGGAWEEIRVVKYWKGYYMVWGHDVYMDPKTDKLYINFRSKTNSQELFADDWAAREFIFPDSSVIQDDRRATGTAYSSSKSYGSSGAVERGEHITLVSEDHGDTWRFATTEDYLPSKK